MIRAKDSEADPVEEHEDIAPVDSPTLPPVVDIVTAIGIRPCMNRRWVLADLDGQKIKVRVIKSRKSPKHQQIKCRHIEADLYEEIR